MVLNRSCVKTQNESRCDDDTGEFVNRQNARLRAVAAQTVAIVEAGGYQATAGEWVEIGPAVAAAVAGTRLYLPDAPLPDRPRDPAPRTVEVTNESSLAAARRLGGVDGGDGDSGDVAMLVFASARNPGGGFRTGARAQEEDVARGSALHACLDAVPDFYAYHRAERDLRYTDRVIHSPAVPVFRDDAGALLARPVAVSMITAAAPNLRAVRSNQPRAARSVPGVLRDRALRVVEVAAAHGHTRLVLGAWGCGVFGNDPVGVADAFAAALDRVGGFARVVFAVLDRAAGTPAYRAFTERFPAGVADDGAPAAPARG
jgi:uncharacterized protein (TIGR02452 family)